MGDPSKERGHGRHEPGGRGRMGRPRRAGERAGRTGVDAGGCGMLAALIFFVMLGVVLVGVMLWGLGSSVAGYFFPDVAAARDHDYAIERVDVDAHLETDGDLRVSQTMVLDFTHDVTDGFTMPMPLSRATADQLQARGVTGTGLSVDLVRDATAGITYRRAGDGSDADPGGTSGGTGYTTTEPGTFAIASLFDVIGINGPQAKGESTWRIDYTLDNAALTWSDAGELIWRYGDAPSGRNVPVHVALTYDGAVAGEAATVGKDLTAQPVEDTHADAAISAKPGAATATIDTTLAGGASGTLHSMFPRDWIADSPMPEPTDGRKRMATGVAQDATAKADLDRQRRKERIAGIAWRIPAALALAMMAVAAVLRIRRGRTRPTFHGRVSDEPVLADRPWLLAALMGEDPAPRAFAAALMRASADGTIRIVDSKHGFSEPDAGGTDTDGMGSGMGDGMVGKTGTRPANLPRVPGGWRLHYAGALDHDPEHGTMPAAAYAAAFCADWVEVQVADGTRSRAAQDDAHGFPAFHVSPRAGGFDVNAASMDAWRRREPWLCKPLAGSVSGATRRAIDATGWLASHGTLGRTVGLVGGLGLMLAALYARKATGDWTTFGIAMVAALAGMVLCMGLRAYAGEGMDLHARGKAVRRWFDRRGRSAGFGKDGFAMDRNPAVRADTIPLGREQARGLLIDAVAMGVDEERVVAFAKAMAASGALAEDDPVAWWCRRNGRKHTPAASMASAFESCWNVDDGSGPSANLG